MKNFKIRCVDQDISDYFVTGDIYEVIDGVIMSKNNAPYNPSEPYFTVKEINKNCVPQFELVEEKPFTKADIKNGMIITYRNGSKRVVFNEVFYDYIVDEIGHKSGNLLKEYNDDLIRYDNFRGQDIMEVEYEGEVLWTRKEYYTLEEVVKEAKEKCKNIKHKDFEEIYNPCCITDVLTLIKNVTYNKPDIDLFESKEFKIVD